MVLLVDRGHRVTKGLINRIREEDMLIESLKNWMKKNERRSIACEGLNCLERGI